MLFEYSKTGIPWFIYTCGSVIKGYGKNPVNTDNRDITGMKKIKTLFNKAIVWYFLIKIRVATSSIGGTKITEIYFNFWKIIIISTGTTKLSNSINIQKDTKKAIDSSLFVISTLLLLINKIIKTTLIIKSMKYAIPNIIRILIYNKKHYNLSCLYLPF